MTLPPAELRVEVVVDHDPRQLDRTVAWEPAVVYQVYPRSFADSNTNGIGDLAGIRCRLLYLEVRQYFS